MRIWLALAICSLAFRAEALEIRRHSGRCPWLLSSRSVSLPAEGIARADLLNFHGYGDRADNHLPLFREFNSVGINAAGYDLPSHGETNGLLRLDFFGFRALARQAIAIESAIRPPGDRPLILSGWSTGGLLLTRLVNLGLLKEFNQPVPGMLLYAPGIYVRPLVGEMGFITQRTLTPDPHPPHEGPIYPWTPFATPLFALNLLYNSWLAQKTPLPTNMDIALFLGGPNEDRYVLTKEILDWAEAQRALGAKIWIWHFEGAMHELDNENSPTRDRVRDISKRFASALIEGRVENEFGVPATFRIPRDAK